MICDRINSKKFFMNLTRDGLLIASVLQAAAAATAAAAAAAAAAEAEAEKDGQVRGEVGPLAEGEGGAAIGAAAGARAGARAGAWAGAGAGAGAGVKKETEEAGWTRAEGNVRAGRAIEFLAIRHNQSPRCLTQRTQKIHPVT